MEQRPSDAGLPVAIEGYDVLDRIGAGGFSVVYRARQRSLDREVAIKVLNLGFATADEQRTFERECHALGRLSHHPNIVTVFNEAMTADGRPCIVMELYEHTFRERIDAEGPLPIPTVLEVGVRVAGALETAHEAGILHRDLKPHNIFVSAYGEPALGDFGISTLDEERSHSGPSGLSVAYAAPEVLEDGRTTAAADVYSLAATLYHLAAGATPFASAQLKTAVRRILTEDPPPLGRADAPPGLDRVLRRALAKDPAQRPASAADLAEQLREVQARLGLEPTPLPRTTTRTAPPVPATPRAPSEPETRPTSSAPPVASAARATPDDAPGDAAGDEEHSITVARPRPAREEAPVAPPPSTTRRWWIGAALAVVVLGGVGVGVGLSGGNSSDDGGPTTTIDASADDPFLDPLTVPTDIEVVATAGGYDVGFAMPDDATSVEVVIVSGSDAGTIVGADTSPAFVASGDSSLCVEVRALGEGGRISAPSPASCSA